MDPIKQNQQPAQMNPEHKKIGPIVATLVIVLVLIFAALYLFAAKVSQRNAAEDITDPTISSTSSTQTVQPVSNTNDDLQSIQNDLNNSTSGVDQQNF